MKRLILLLYRIISNEIIRLRSYQNANRMRSLPTFNANKLPEVLLTFKSLILKDLIQLKPIHHWC